MGIRGKDALALFRHDAFQPIVFAIMDVLRPLLL